MTGSAASRPTFSRRGLLGAAGAGAGLGAAGLVGGWALGAQSAEPDSATVAFEGRHQAGIVTPAQDRLYFAAFDLTTDSRAELVALLQRWTAAARQLTGGQEVSGGGPAAYLAPPDDTGEALGLPAARLTLTFGFGPTLFRTGTGTDRSGLASRQPRLLRRLPHFPADRLDPARSDGDLCVQACADDPQVAFHAVRNLARLAFGVASLRWAQLGFGRTSSTSTSQETPRNLFGFKDGTANLKAEETEDVDRFVWVGADDDPRAAWLAGGTYLVARRISMSIETWDRTSLEEQERITGRDKPHGAPMSGGEEFTEPDFTATADDGTPAIAMNAHVRLAHPSQHGGQRMLRRGYNFTDGNDELGRMDAGLFFVAFVRDPARQYVPIQNRLSSEDGLMEYLTHTGSALFAVPPGVGADGYVGETLLG